MKRTIDCKPKQNISYNMIFILKFIFIYHKDKSIDELNIKIRAKTFLGWIIYFKISSIERDENCTKASWKELIKHTNLRVLN